MTARLTARPPDERLVDRLLGPAEHALRARVRAVVDEHVAPRAAEADRTAAFAGDSYQALAGAGLAGLLFPAQYGGQDASTLGYAMAMEEIACACGATSLIYMTQTHAGYPILLAGTEEQRRRFLPGLCTGRSYGSLAITEPSAGSDAAALRTRARREDDGYVLDGAKTFITTGDRADVIVCFATVDRGAGRDGITVFVIPGDAPGLTRGRVLRKMGMHGSSTAELFFDGVRLPADARLGPERGGWELLTRSVVKSRISAAAQGIGLARGAYAAAVGWAKRSGVLDRDGDQRGQFKLAELRSRVLTGRLLLYGAAAAVDEDGRGEELDADVSMMKLTCTNLGMAVATEVAELLGPRGDLAESQAERYLRDAKVTQIYDGTNEVQRLLIARDIARGAGEGDGVAAVSGGHA
ncbi:MAG: acyl-CoA dehydrogenase family protein [Streptosporangiaceae bacterium]